jgi:hypothetical protein
MKKIGKKNAITDRKIQKSYIKKHSNRSQSRKAGKASYCNSLQQSWKIEIQKEINNAKRHLVALEVVLGLMKKAMMKSSEKKTILKHIKKDDKEFRAQIKDDMKLKKQITKSGKKR